MAMLGTQGDAPRGHVGGWARLLAPAHSAVHPADGRFIASIERRADLKAGSQPDWSSARRLEGAVAMSSAMARRAGCVSARFSA